MILGEPRIRTMAQHNVVIAITDGPILERRRRPSGGIVRFQADRLRIAYVDGLLTSAEVSGTELTVSGAPHARGYGASIDYETRDGGALVDDAPDWVREAVAAHPWPADRDLAGAWSAGYDAGDRDAHALAEARAAGSPDPEPTRNPHA